MQTPIRHSTTIQQAGGSGRESAIFSTSSTRPRAILAAVVFVMGFLLVPLAGLAAVSGQTGQTGQPVAEPGGSGSPIPAIGTAAPAVSPEGPPHAFLRLELKKTAPLSGAVRTGGAVSFMATAHSGDDPAPLPGYVFRWESDAGAKFLDPEGPSGNTAVFTRPGPQKVWVTALAPVDGLLEPVAVSEPLEMDVAGPLFRLSIDPREPRVGEEIRASVKDFPVREDVDFRWAALPRNATLVNVGEKEITFYLHDGKPAEVAVSARMPLAGKDLGRVAAEVTARPYPVEVSNKGLVGPRPVIWKDGSGPEEIDAVPEGGAVLLRADVNPMPGNPPLAFTWRLPPGTRLEAGESGRQVKVACDRVGDYKAVVEIRDSRDLLVGRGEGAFSATVSKADMDLARQNAAQTAKLTAEAVRLWNRGEVEQAVDMASKAAAMNPKSVDAAGEYRRMAADRERLLDLLHRAGEHLSRDEFAKTAGLLDEAGRINGQYGGISGLERRMGERKDTLAKVDALMASSGQAWNAGDVEGAVRAVQSALALDPGHEAALAQRARLVDGRDKIIAGLKEAAVFLEKKQFESAASALAGVRGINEKFPPFREMDAAVAKRRENAWQADQLLARARELWTAGDMDAALGALSDILKADPEHAGARAAKQQTAQAREVVLKNVDQAKAFLAQNHPDEALAALSRAKGVNPAYAPVREIETAVAERKNRAGRIRDLTAKARQDAAKGDLDAALASVENILALDPADGFAKPERVRLAGLREETRGAMRLAEGLAASGRHGKALETLAAASAKAPGYPPLAAQKARIAEMAGASQKKASGVLAEASARLSRGDFSGTLAALAGLEGVNGVSAADDRKAKELARAAKAGQDKATTAQAAKASADAAKAAAPAAGQGQKKARCDELFRRADSRRGKGEHAAAIKDYQEIVTTCPDYCTAYNNIGASLFTLGYARESLPWFEEARKCDPGEKLFADNVALTTRLATNPSGQKTPASSRPDCSGAFDQAEKLRAKGDLAGAVRDYRKVVEACPDYCAAYNNIGLALNTLGHVKESLPWFEEAYRCNPKEALFQDNIHITTKQMQQASRDRPPGT
ncbi:tetratricopeptide repeat protein [Desulfovibrio sulfodismutans]|uniref:Tetratricopeptide repeat protein n=1 Tax=Desulfolutivibrio sulfodismutans TaxID=63561 RepID=A0A7K3NQH5_9BACT|nr:tetratricopeptide repeat protein [Desulfolutivibrio sulfodismutans]NDY58428.1 tetratricopeptide repeat protein [Desulfolutivibrio sulfodismutans]QLA10794.1 tetratricopeptide repeat protein [Desulfolutivibrio sulfodismutans DSM 3696]